MNKAAGRLLPQLQKVVDIASHGLRFHPPLVGPVEPRWNSKSGHQNIGSGEPGNFCIPRHLYPRSLENGWKNQPEGLVSK